MNFNNEDTMRKLKERITERETWISDIQSSMWKTVGLNCLCLFITFTVNAVLAGLSCDIWLIYLFNLHILEVSVVSIFLISMKMFYYVDLYKDQDTDIEKLEALKRARPNHAQNIHHAKEGVAPWIFCAVILLLLVVFNFFVYYGANVLFAAACTSH